MSNNQKIASLVKNLQTDANGNTTGIITGNVLANSVSTQSANLGPVGNLKITGGSAGYYLKTDGTGNVDWQPQTPSLPGGANTTVQYNLGGTLTGDTSFRFTPEDDTVRVDNLSAVGNVVISGTTTLGPVTNISISGGSNGYVLTTDGAGDLSWTDGGSGSVKQVDTAGGGLGFTLTGGPITDTGTVTLGVPSEVVLRSSLNIGTVANISLNGNGEQYLSGNGQWAENISGDNLDVNGVPVVPLDNRINFQDGVSGVNDINFLLYGANIQAELNPDVPLTMNNQVTAQSFRLRDIVNGNSITLRTYDTFDNQVYDLPDSYPLANLQVLAGNVTDNGFSRMSWINLQNAQPFISFSVFQPGNGQQFTSANLATFTNSNYAAVFKNGALLRPGDYTITGTTLIVNTYLQAEDTLDVLPTSGSMAGGTGGGGGGNAEPVGLNGQLQYNDEGFFGASPAMSFDKTTGRTTLSILSSNLANVDTANVTNLFWTAANATSATIGNVISNISTANTLNVSGNANINNLTTSGNLTTANIVVTGAANIANLAGNVANFTTISGSNANIAAVTTGTLAAGNGSFTGGVEVVGTANVSTLSALTGVVANLQVNDNTSLNVLSANTATVANLNVTSNVVTSGNITAKNLNSVERIVAGGNIVGGNLVTAGALYADLDSYFNEDLYIGGNLNVTGNINTTDLSNVTVANATISMGTGSNPPLTFNDGADRGLLLYYYDDTVNEQKIAFTGWDVSTREMMVARDITDVNGIITYNQLANLRAESFIGNVATGNISNGTSNIAISNTEVVISTAGDPNVSKITVGANGLSTKNIITSSIVAPDNVFGSTLTLGTGAGSSNENKVVTTTPYFVFDSYLSEEMQIVTTDNTVRMFGDWNAGYPGAKSPANVFIGNALTTTTLAGNVIINNTVTSNTVTSNTLVVNTLANLGSVGNVKITGGNVGQYLQTDGGGNLSWTAISGGSTILNGNSNISIALNGNINMSAAGNDYVVIVSGTGANIDGTLGVTGNTFLNRLAVSGNTALANLTVSGNVVGNLTVTGTITAGSFGNWSSVNGWNFGGSTTAPTSPTASQRRYIWSVVGKTMYIKGYFLSTSNSGATAGSGEYLLTLPGGYTIDTDATGTAAVGNITAIPVGTCTLDIVDMNLTGHPLVFNSNNIKFVVWQISQGGGTGSGYYNIGSTNRRLNETARWQFYFTAEIPVL